MVKQFFYLKVKAKLTDCGNWGLKQPLIHLGQANGMIAILKSLMVQM